MELNNKFVRDSESMKSLVFFGANMINSCTPYLYQIKYKPSIKKSFLLKKKSLKTPLLDEFIYPIATDEIQGGRLLSSQVSM